MLFVRNKIETTLLKLLFYRKIKNTRFEFQQFFLTTYSIAMNLHWHEFSRPSQNITMFFLDFWGECSRFLCLSTHHHYMMMKQKIIDEDNEIIREVFSCGYMPCSSLPVAYIKGERHVTDNPCVMVGSWSWTAMRATVSWWWSVTGPTLSLPRKPWSTGTYTSENITDPKRQCCESGTFSWIRIRNNLFRFRIQAKRKEKTD